MVFKATPWKKAATHPHTIPFLLGHRRQTFQVPERTAESCHDASGVCGSRSDLEKSAPNMHKMFESLESRSSHCHARSSRCLADATTLKPQSMKYPTKNRRFTILGFSQDAHPRRGSRERARGPPALQRAHLLREGQGFKQSPPEEKRAGSNCKTKPLCGFRSFPQSRAFPKPLTNRTANASQVMRFSCGTLRKCCSNCR